MINSWSTILKRGCLCLALASSCAFSAVASAEEQKPDGLTFEESVLPIFKERCATCHAGEKPKAGLNLTSRRGVLAGGDSGAAVRRGAAEFSLLWEKIAGGAMPPKGEPLTAEEKGVIRRWINDGAKGSGANVDHAPTAAAGVSDAARDFWSFRTPRRPPVPSVDNAGRNAIDAFIIARLQQQALTLSAEANRPTLIRRACYDLIGLPPSPEEVRAFVDDDRPDAYERLIDRLLASPRYGERWGRHWLDLAGYADSAGILNEDRALPLAYRYRDYVIRAFNKDKPYDRFLQEQIAGDELVDYWRHYENDQRLADEVVEAIIATGYLRCASDPSRPDFKTIKNADALYFYPTINDTIKIVSTGVLGITVHCARCHDHMYDPVPQEDFYRLQAVLMGAYRPSDWIPQMNRRLKIATKSQQEDADQVNAEVTARVKQILTEAAALKTQYRDKLLDQRLVELPDSIRQDVKLALLAAPDKRGEVQKYLAEKFAAHALDEKTLDKTLAEAFPGFQKQADRIKADIAAQQARRIEFAEVRALYDLPGEVATPFLRRGDALTPMHNVAPGALSVLDKSAPFEWSRPAESARTSGRRLAFARWLTRGDHPLTPRVMANRIWLHHFGRGIVDTPDDFGAMGAEPAHPALLDWLAVELVESGWSVKHLHRLMMTSAAYRQDSTLDPTRHSKAISSDPDNLMLWRQRIRRLEAEPLRDGALHAAGALNARMFGAPVPMQRHADGEVTIKSGHDPRRRSVYLQILRLTPLTMLNSFDQPVMETNCLLRSRSTVSTQALTLLNSQSTIEMAGQFAQRVLREAPTRPASRAVWLAYSRAPSEAEREMLAEFLQLQTEHHLAALAPEAATRTFEQQFEARRRAVADMCHMLLSANEFIYID